MLLYGELDYYNYDAVLAVEKEKKRLGIFEEVSLYNHSRKHFLWTIARLSAYCYYNKFGILV
jgi:hypothetical protein